MLSSSSKAFWRKAARTAVALAMSAVMAVAFVPTAGLAVSQATGDGVAYAADGDAFDLSQAEVYFNSSIAISSCSDFDELAEALGIVVYDDNWYVVDSSEFTLEFYDSDYQKLTNVPEEIDLYYFKIVAVEGGACAGESGRFGFDVLADDDLRIAHLAFGESAWWSTSENAYCYLSDNAPDSFSLVGGNGATIDPSSYQAKIAVFDEDSEGYGEPAELTSLPTELGKYQLSFYAPDPEEGGFAVEPSLEVNFFVCEPFEFTSETIYAYYMPEEGNYYSLGDDDEILFTGEPVQLRFEIEFDNETTWLAEDEDYTLTFYDADDEELEETPSDIGSYTAVLTGINKFAGSSFELTFSIVGPSELSSANTALEENKFIETGEPVELDVEYIDEEGDTDYLEEDEDYTIAYKQGNNVLDEAPSAVGEYVAVITGMGRYSGTVELPFSIAANPVHHISYTPATRYEAIYQVDGNYKRVSIGEDEDEQEVRYFVHRPDRYCNEGDVVTLYASESDTQGVAYTYNDDEDFVSAEGKDLEGWGIEATGETYDNPYTLSEDGTEKTYNDAITFSYSHRTCSIPLTIVPNPVESIELTPVTAYKLTEAVDASELKYDPVTDDELDKPWLKYHLNPSDDDILTLNFTNGTSKQYRYNAEEEDFYDENGLQPDREVYWDIVQSPANQLTVGLHENAFEITCYGRSDYADVTIEPNDIVAIDYELSESFTVNRADAYADEEGDFYFDLRAPCDGDKLTVTKLGIDDPAVYAYDASQGLYINEDDSNDVIDGEEVYIARAGSGYEDGDDSIPEVGDPFEIRVSYMGRTCTVEAEFSANPVQAISYEPVSADIFEGIDCYTDDDGSVSYYYTPKVGDKLTVTTDDGSKVYTCTPRASNGYGYEVAGDYVAADGDTIKRHFVSTWLSNYGEWSLDDGKDKYLAVEYAGNEVHVPMNFVANTVAGIVYRPASSRTFTEGTDFTCSLNTWGSDGKSDAFYTFGENGVFADGDTLEVTYTNNTTKTFTYANGAFKNGDDVLPGDVYYCSDYDGDTYNYIDWEYGVDFVPLQIIYMNQKSELTVRPEWDSSKTKLQVLFAASDYKSLYVTRGSTLAEADIPAAKPTRDNGNGTHTTYTWVSATPADPDDYIYAAENAGKTPQNFLTQPVENPVRFEQKTTTSECTYGEWSVKTPATETENGEKVHSCTVCGHEETEVIPATGAGDQEAADAVIEQINALPETVTNDEELQQVNAALAAYNALDEATKRLVDASEGVTAKLAAAQAAADEYAANQGGSTSIADATVTVSGSYTYTGSAIVPNVTVTLNNEELIADTDYTVSCDAVNAGTATATITGKGDYKDSKTFTFTIQQKTLFAAGQTGTEVVQYSHTVAYTGQRVVPAVTIKDGDVTLKAGVDYDLTEPVEGSAIEPGTYEIDVAFKGNYAGSTVLQYEIIQSGTSDPVTLTTENVKLDSVFCEYANGNPVVPLVLFKDDSVEGGWRGASSETEMDLTYETKGGTSLNSVTQLGDYLAVVSGKGTYTGTVKLPFTITDKHVVKQYEIATGYAPEVEYFGEPCDPELAIWFGSDGVELKVGTDYDISYYKDVNANGDLDDGDELLGGLPNELGSFLVAVTFKGDYVGSYSAPLKVVPGIEVMYEGMVAYTGKPCNLDFKMTLWNGSELTEGTDYDLSYCKDANGNGVAEDGEEMFNAPPSEAGKYALCVTFKGDYASRGTRSYGFIIEKSDEQIAADKQAAGSVASKIKALPTLDGITDADAAKVKAARAAYNKLTAEQKALVPAATLKTLEAAEKAVATTKTVNAGKVKAAAVTKAAKGNITTIALGPKVKTLAKSTFKKAKKVKTLIVKTTKLKKGKIKNSLKGSKITTVKVPKVKLKAYKKIFTKKICGKKVKVVGF